MGEVTDLEAIVHQDYQELGELLEMGAVMEGQEAMVQGDMGAMEVMANTHQLIIQVKALSNVLEAE